MKIYVEVTRDRTDLFCDEEQIDIELIKAEIESYYGFPVGYRFEPAENAIYFFNRSQLERVKKLMQEVRI